jgi:hypothetical protein
MAAELRRSAENPITPALAAHLRYVEGSRLPARRVPPAATALEPLARDVEQGLIDHASAPRRDSSRRTPTSGTGRPRCILAERALDRARELRWPRAIGHSLANFAPPAPLGRRAPARGGAAPRGARGARGHRARASSRSRATTSATRSSPSGARGSAREPRARRGLMRDLGAHPRWPASGHLRAGALAPRARAGCARDRAQAALELARSIRSKLWEVEALRALAESTRRTRQGHGGTRASPSTTC